MSRSDKIIEIIKEVCFRIDDTYEITPDTNIITDLGQDSLDMVLIVDRLEEEFGVIVGNETFQEIQTVADIDRKLEELLGTSD